MKVNLMDGDGSIAMSRLFNDNNREIMLSLVVKNFYNKMWKSVIKKDNIGE